MSVAMTSSRRESILTGKTVLTELVQDNDGQRAASALYAAKRRMMQRCVAVAYRRRFRIQSVAEAEKELRALEEGITPVPPISVDVADVFEHDFDALLRGYYAASDQNLRPVPTVAQQALLEAVGLGEEIISIASLREAALGLAF